MTDSPKPWLVLGASGMLGTDLVALLTERGIPVTAAARADVDVTDPAQVDAAVAHASVVVNCAAYTAVDAAETDVEAATALNATAPGIIAAACAQHGARLVHVSTDYVFAGDATAPYAEDAPIAPASVYGTTKAAGEEAVRDSGADALIVRTAWLYGAHGPCFPKTIARVAAERGEIAVVNDQTGQPTWTWDLADFIHRLVDAAVPAGIYHGTSSGSGTWYDFTRAILDSAHIAATLNATTTDAFPRPAPRPAWSVLAHGASEKAGVATIGNWRDRWAVASGLVLT